MRVFVVLNGRNMLEKHCLDVDIRFKLSIKGAGREMQISASSAVGKRILACLAGES